MGRLSVLLLLLSAVAWGKSWNYQGTLDAPAVKGALCEGLLPSGNYEAKVFSLQPNHLRAVIHFVGESPDGALHKQTLVGWFGGMGDVRVEKKGEYGPHRITYVAEGIIDAGILYVGVGVQLEAPASGEVLCTAVAEYTGFR